MSKKSPSIYFSNHAEKKFEILNKHKIYFTHELIEECLSNPDDLGKIGNLNTAKKDNIKVVYKKELELVTVLTFYPVTVN